MNSAGIRSAESVVEGEHIEKHNFSGETSWVKLTCRVKKETAG
jgi:hypothetical protein